VGGVDVGLYAAAALATDDPARDDADQARVRAALAAYEAASERLLVAARSRVTDPDVMPAVDAFVAARRALTAVVATLPAGEPGEGPVVGSGS